MWNGSEQRVVRDGVLKLIWDKREGESILPERRLERKERLETCRRLAREEIFRARRTGA